jgi:hypothetical protein
MYLEKISLDLKEENWDEFGMLKIILERTWK